MDKVEGQNWHSLSAERALKLMKSSRGGLAPALVVSRLSIYGRNEIKMRERSPVFRIIARQFLSPIVAMLVLAAGLAFFAGDPANTVIIGVTVAMTLLFGVVQEYKAERALRILRKAVKPLGRVIRASREQIIDSVFLVPGDIIHLQAGDLIPADCRIIEGSDAGTDESVLTGESLTVAKNPAAVPADSPITEKTSMLWSGTIFARGEARALVVATGQRTEFSQVARSIAQAQKKRPLFEKQLFGIVALTMQAAAAVIVIVGIIGLYRGFSLNELLLLALALSVSAVPEGISVTITAIMAVGMIKMLEAKALVRRLISVETLGAITVLCLDKTGTLTQGKMAVVEVGGDKKRAFNLALSGIGSRIADVKVEAKDWQILGDPTEAAILRAGIDFGLAEKFLERQVIADLPFNAERRYRAAVSEVSGERLLIVLGAPETVLKHCRQMEKDGVESQFLSEHKKEIENRLSDYASCAVRVVALGYRRLADKEGIEIAVKSLPELTFVSLFGLSDPVRSEANEVMEKIKKAGVRPVMITGDNPVTARAVAEVVGIGKEEIISWEQVSASNEPDELYKRINIFARVAPVQKLRIVRGMQRVGEVVAMTGDGVNDAPAIKQADIGVVMGSGQDVTKGAADLVLLDDRLERIHRAIIEGRRIYDNIRKLAVFLLYDCLAEIFLIALALFLALPLPLLPGQILWVNIIADALPSFGFAFEPADREIRHLPPRPKSERILSREHQAFMAILGALTAFLLFLLYIYAMRDGRGIEYTRTIVFVGLGIASLFVAYSLRSFRRNFFALTPWANRPMMIFLALGVAMNVAAVYVPNLSEVLKTVPLGGYDWLFLVFFGSVHLIIAEFLKKLFLRGKTVKFGLKLAD